jgi:hypothetical protein
VAAIEAIHSDLRQHIRYTKILDPDMPVTEPFARRHSEMEARLVHAGCPAENILEMPLLAPLDTIRSELLRFVEAAGDHIILDITAMPKRWFFPLVKALIANEGVRSLVVTYASAESYSETLSSNPDPLRALPGFASDDARTGHDTAIVAIGFEPLGLDELYAAHQIDKVRYIFPFPPGPPGFHRNWHFVRKLERAILNREAGQDERWHIHMYDCPAVFEALCTATSGGSRTSVLAPYGPKTTSLAMCLFATAVERAKLPQAPVYYAQPRRYAIDYSTGIKLLNGRSDIQGYCVKLNGRNLYDLREAR